MAILQPLTATPLARIKYYGFAHGEVAGRKAIISRTGYTGEDGFELFVAPQDAMELWRALFAAGETAGLVPAGLGARDTLRLEAGMALYGHEIDRATTPWDARLDWTVKLDKGDFVGRAALVAARARGESRHLVGYEVESRGIARQGCAIVNDGQQVGVVTSGTWSPTFEKALGMGYVPVALAAVGTAVEIDSTQSDCLMAASDRLAAAVTQENTLGALVTRHTAAALCVANRLAGVRAICVSDAGRLAAAAEAVGANVLVLDPQSGLFTMKRLLAEFCRDGVRACPEVFQKRLG